MDLQDNLIESQKQKRKGGWAPALSVVAHAGLIGAIVFATATASQKVTAENKPIRAFVTQGAAPPPPPPPPPPPAASSSAPRATPHVVPKVEPIPVHNPMTPPHEIPKEIPKVQTPATTSDTKADTSNDSQPETLPTQNTGGQVGGVIGGVAGGVQGGTVGGEVGGQVGGVLGGEKGGVVGGELGGKVGGTGTGTAGEGTGGKEAPVEKPEPPSGPLRVGGDVKAPVAIGRVQPEYTEVARSARIQGVVIVEAVIDKNGNVDQVRVIKGLPMGLSEQAAEAVKRWHFKPGTLGGQPVDVIFNLTVNFTLG